ncbi:MAG: hypothetical protein A2887_02840 [Alphaproteobacteria bacterium RIFCSPLOWO2_01_FULL_40_26]|nr:MAG: hypothetical protein A3D15_02695 [Alphaproteobacteria bacterium RIFCSPHIGHO2_02_FULL_40_34]OFW95102.1 MAG: hypothetical protein A2887_02840 [Alphaproteobacteria bacterium RIFCSPLOWO2_01_FULL_40_26]OFX09075.1 MAG: hypothetical protein A3H30_03510 [Alphaproteobacteria bacterium RIFCSPLOWO2_02_FULL_40_19]OFX10704.1 MAG: hypothetical protein A3G22_03270 [Alphaproteobacteria bacterium RIFCSPLOWO2_12_FULL_40_11]
MLISKVRFKIIVLPLFLCFITSCTNSDLSRYGRVTLHNTADRNSFIFTVTDEFTNLDKNSPIDKKHPKLTEAEAKLLITLLRQRKYCLYDNNTPSFIITSRQEKIFDMTFAHLIEKNYNARPIVPQTYFGECTK